jgi:hypothetical protein
MNLDAVFNPSKPNLAAEFAIGGLKPVLRDLNSEMYLLTDNDKKFYL